MDIFCTCDVTRLTPARGTPPPTSILFSLPPPSYSILFAPSFLLPSSAFLDRPSFILFLSNLFFLCRKQLLSPFLPLPGLPLSTLPYDSLPCFPLPRLPFARYQFLSTTARSYTQTSYEEYTLYLCPSPPPPFPWLHLF